MGSTRTTRYPIFEDLMRKARNINMSILYTLYNIHDAHKTLIIKTAEIIKLAKKRKIAERIRDAGN